MDIDQQLNVALQQYSHLRRRIGHSIAHSVPELPHHGGRDMLACIERLGQPNLSAVAEALGITRGGVSKGVAKLKRIGLLETFQTEDNRKELYLRLTMEGERALNQHRQALDVLHEQESAYLSTLTPAQKRIILDFLTGFTAHLRAAWPMEEKKEVSS